MTPVTPDLRLTAATFLRPGEVFVDPRTERRHTARGVLFDRGRVRVRDASGTVVLSEPESYLIAIEEPPK